MVVASDRRCEAAEARGVGSGAVLMVRRGSARCDAWRQQARRQRSAAARDEVVEAGRHSGAGARGPVRPGAGLPRALAGRYGRDGDQGCLAHPGWLRMAGTVMPSGEVGVAVLDPDPDVCKF